MNQEINGAQAPDSAAGAIAMEGSVDLANKKNRSGPDRPLVTIITSTYNAAEHLPSAIKSIRNQSYSNVEWIVVDGASKDGTLDILRQNQDVVDHWVSEPDAGIYDAWNKGLRLAHGEWVWFLGADDEMVTDAIEVMMEVVRNSPIPLDFVCGKVELYRGPSRIRAIGKPWSWRRFKKYMCVAHTGAMHRASYFDRYGEFDDSFRISGDYEILLRAGAELKAGFTQNVLARMQVGGESNRNPIVFQEALRARLKHAVTSPWGGRVDALWAECKWNIRRFFGL
ncbi:MAG: glycosyltransferase [Porticoccaceae bacterium]|nr:glycosyltransferase [Porticoccaceae bacterium]